MPNWCQNELDIKGNKESLNNFLKDNVINKGDDSGDKILNLNYLVPLDTKTNNEAVEKWGTKWIPDIIFLNTDKDGEVYISFDSAWTPPLNWLNIAMDKYPDLYFSLRYIEGGCAFCGILNNDAEMEWSYPDSKYQQMYEDIYGEPLDA